MKYLRTKQFDVGALDSFPGNARVHDDNALDESTQANGQYRSIVAREMPDGRAQVLAGHGTLAALTRGGAAKVRVELIAADDTEARRIVLADNGTSRAATYDDGALLALLSDANADGGLTGTGWDSDALTALLDSQATDFADDTAGDPDVDDVDVEPPVDAITQPGDVWLLGPHRVLCGDCREPGVIERLMGGVPVNVAFTSPPYASQRKYDESSGFRPIPPGEYVDWFDAVQASVRSVLAADGSWFVNIKEHASDGQRDLYVKDLTVAHVRSWSWFFVDELCWVDTNNGVPGGWPNRFKDAWEPVFHFAANRQIKFNPLANGKQSENIFTYSPDIAKAGTGSGLLGGESRNGMGDGIARPSNVLHIAAASATGIDHSAQFPVALPQWFIAAYSDPGDTIFDPFMGSGTTMVAAHLEGRTAYGVEISPGYCDVIARRYQNLTGDMPVLERTGQRWDFTAVPPCVAP